MAVMPSFFYKVRIDHSAHSIDLPLPQVNSAMEITLHTKNLIDNIGALFVKESGSNDPLPPEGLLIQYLNEANARLRTIFGRFMEAFFQEHPDNSLGMGDAFVYRLVLSSRREANKGQALTDLAHEYLVHSALAKVYTSMSDAQRASLHEGMAVSAGQSIDQNLHSKLPPIQ